MDIYYAYRLEQALIKKKRGESATEPETEPETATAPELIKLQVMSCVNCGQNKYWCLCYKPEP